MYNKLKFVLFGVLLLSASVFSLGMAPSASAVAKSASVTPHLLIPSASIKCVSNVPTWHFGLVKIKAWGVDFPRNRDIMVTRTLWRNHEFWREEERRLHTSRSGSWSTPTDTYFVDLNGNYRLKVKVTTDNGRLLGTSYEYSCRIDF